VFGVGCNCGEYGGVFELWWLSDSKVFVGCSGMYEYSSGSKGDVDGNRKPRSPRLLYMSRAFGIHVMKSLQGQESGLREIVVVVSLLRCLRMELDRLDIHFIHGSGCSL